MFTLWRVFLEKNNFNDIIIDTIFFFFTHTMLCVSCDLYDNNCYYSKVNQPYQLGTIEMLDLISALSMSISQTTTISAKKKTIKMNSNCFRTLRYWNCTCIRGVNVDYDEFTWLIFHRVYTGFNISYSTFSLFFIPLSHSTHNSKSKWNADKPKIKKKTKTNELK